MADIHYFKQNASGQIHQIVLEARARRRFKFKILLSFLIFAMSLPFALRIIEFQRCHVKGNISASGQKLYYVPIHPRYDLVKIDKDKGEVCFENDYQAIKAGWDIAPAH